MGAHGEKARTRPARTPRTKSNTMHPQVRNQIFGAIQSTPEAALPAGHAPTIKRVTCTRLGHSTDWKHFATAHLGGCTENWFSIPGTVRN